MEDYSQTEFLAAVAHECAHVKRDDYRKNVLYEMVSLLTAFHPLTWYVKSQITQTREMVCDRMAAEQLPDRRAYALSLLQLASKMQAATSTVSHAMGMFDAKILERRVMTLITSMPRLGRMQRTSWTVTAILLLSICAGGIGLMTRTVAAQTVSLSSPAPDLACTYYDNMAVMHDGTCGYDKNDKTKYRCYLNSDMAQSQSQSSCEWKLRRLEEWKSKK
jgi:beta-lactamase regulating signal transducer with metallopeptidase domain